MSASCTGLSEWQRTKPSTSNITLLVILLENKGRIFKNNKAPKTRTASIDRAKLSSIAHQFRNQYWCKEPLPSAKGASLNHSTRSVRAFYLASQTPK